MTDLDAALAAIWDRSRPVLRERLATVEQTAAALAGGSLDEAARADGIRAAHQLAGSLGTFGLGEGSELAREIETRLGAPDPDAAGVGELSARLSALLGPRL